MQISVSTPAAALASQRDYARHTLLVSECNTALQRSLEALDSALLTLSVGKPPTSSTLMPTWRCHSMCALSLVGESYVGSHPLGAPGAGTEMQSPWEVKSNSGLVPIARDANALQQPAQERHMPLWCRFLQPAGLPSPGAQSHCAELAVVPTGKAAGCQHFYCTATITSSMILCLLGGILLL